jgi:hypothetical protein
MHSGSYPYVIGAELVICLKELENDSTCRVKVKVLESRRLTDCQEMKVTILGILEGHGKQLPSYAILKVYDRRFISQRDRLDPWNLEKEAKAMEIHDLLQPLDKASQHLPDISVSGFASCMCETSEREFLEWTSNLVKLAEVQYAKDVDSHADEEAVDRWVAEMIYHYQALSAFRAQFKAYEGYPSLKLQFGGVPAAKLYGVTLFDNISGFPFCCKIPVPGILMEFVDAN